MGCSPNEALIWPRGNDAELLASRTEREDVSAVLSHQVCCNLLQQPQETNTLPKPLIGILLLQPNTSSIHLSVTLGGLTQGLLPLLTMRETSGDPQMPANLPDSSLPDLGAATF